MNDKPTADEISALANNPNKLVQAADKMDKVDSFYGDEIPDDIIEGKGFTAKPKPEDNFLEGKSGVIDVNNNVRLWEGNNLVDGNYSIPPSQEQIDHAIKEGFLPPGAKWIPANENLMTATLQNNSVEITEDEPIPTWELDGKTYPKYLFDSYGTQVLPIVENGETFGHIGVKFHWEKAEPFLEALDMKSEDVTDAKTQKTKSNYRNANIALSKLFRDIIVDGFIEEIDEFGNTTKTEMDARQLIDDVPQEFQASLVFEFLNALTVERYYKPGSSRLSQLLKPDTGSIFFLCKLGQFAWLMEFKVPNADERRAYETNIRITERTVDEKGTKVTTTINNLYKRRFATEHFLNVTGISLETEGQDYDAVDANHKLKFRAFFPATWWILLADKLAMCFDKTGK